METQTWGSQEMSTEAPGEDEVIWESVLSKKRAALQRAHSVTSWFLHTSCWCVLASLSFYFTPLIFPSFFQLWSAIQTHLMYVLLICLLRCIWILKIAWWPCCVICMSDALL